MRSRSLIPYVLIVIAVLLAYAPALRCGFVWDDTALVLRDPLIRSPLLLLEGLRHFLFIDATPSNFFRPLQRAVYTADYAVKGFSPLVFHLTNILIHAAAALALFEFGRRLLRRARPEPGPDANLAPACIAFAVALLWAVHPIHSSAVAYVSGLADPLTALFGFGGLALLLANRRVAAGFCLGAALFAKESGAVLILIGLGVAWFTIIANEQGEGPSALSGAAFRTRLAAFARVALPALLMVLLYAGLRVSAERVAPPAPPPVPAAVRPILALRALAGYGQLLIAPVTLTMERDVSTRTGGAVAPTLAAARALEFQTLAGAVLLAAGALWFRRAGPGFSIVRQCLAAAGLAYLPISNLFVLNATMAEHWVYVPSAFLFLAVAASATPVVQTLRHRRALVLTVTGILAIATVALAIRTANRCRDWRTQKSFFEATIRSGGDSDRMFTNRAVLKLSRKDAVGAAADFREALARKPEQPMAMLGLAQALIRLRKWNEARQWVDRCDRIPLVRAEALVNRAALDYAETGRDGIDLLLQAAEVNPHFWPVRRRYVLHLMERGEDGKALRDLRALLVDQSFRAETWEILARLLKKNGEHAAATTAFSEAARLDVHLRGAASL